MSKIFTPHQNSQSLANGLLPQMETVLPRLASRPWNRYEWLDTEWLISPVKEFPLYRPCKYFTMMDKVEDPAESRLRAGLYVEKGYGDVARALHPEKQIMEDDWGWPRFLEGFKSGAIPSVLNGLSGPCKAQIELNLFGGYDDSEGRLVEETFGDYTFTLKGNDSLAVDVEAKSKETASLADVKDWKHLVAALDTLTRDDYLWLNFYLGLSMPIAPRVGTPKGEVWTDDIVWTRFLKPFLPWITMK